jgi:hypothetical protein
LVSIWNHEEDEEEEEEGGLFVSMFFWFAVSGNLSDQSSSSLSERTVRNLCHGNNQNRCGFFAWNQIFALPQHTPPRLSVFFPETVDWD